MILSAVHTRILPWLRIHRLRLLLLFVGVLVPLALFGALATDVMAQRDFFFDRPILFFMRGHANPLFDNLMLFFSFVGYRFGVLPVDILVLVILLRRRRWGDVLFWSLAIGGAALLNLAAKQLFARVRPALWLSIAPETTFSFPSGHAMASSALVTALAVLLWPTRWRWPMLGGGAAFVVLVGLSRVYLGVHYPSDILAGWGASVAWVLGVSMVLYGRGAKASVNAEPISTADTSGAEE